MTTIKEWSEKIGQWDKGLLERQIKTINAIHYEIIDSFDLRTILAIMEGEMANRRRGSVLMTTHIGMQ